MGKVCMDLNSAVPEYKETTEESIKGNRGMFNLIYLMDGVTDEEKSPLTQAQNVHLRH